FSFLQVRLCLPMTTQTGIAGADRPIIDVFVLSQKRLVFLLSIPLLTELLQLVPTGLVRHLIRPRGRPFDQGELVFAEVVRPALLPLAAELVQRLGHAFLLLGVGPNGAEFAAGRSATACRKLLIDDLR